MIQIKCRFKEKVLWEGQAESVRAAVIKAVKEGADLEGADLEGANLRGADLEGANLMEANLRGSPRQIFLNNEKFR